MPSINLIASRRADRQKAEGATRTMIYFTATEIGVMLIILSCLCLRLVQTNQNVDQLNDRIEKLKPSVAAIQTLQDQTLAMQPKLDALNTARGNTLYWYSALQDLTASLPQGTWLTSVGTLGDPNNVASGATGQAATTTAALNVAGMAPTPDQVGQTMLQINQHPTLDSATLNFVQQAGDAAHPQVTFQMVVQLKPKLAGSYADETGVGGTNVTKS
jgi:Tfp pilus assembly protein PilN